MSGGRRRALAVVVAAQVAVVLGLAGVAAADLAFGREVRLRVQPVDPLDVFRGNYVILSYEISTIPAPFDVQRGDPLCAHLAERDGTWVLTHVTDVPRDDGTSICGRARSDAAAGTQVGVEYGIETYYANLDRAREIEDAMARRRVHAVLDVDDDGSARVERLEVE